MKVKAVFFDQMSEQWDTICRHDEMKLRYLLSRVSIQSGDSVLDVGTGTGVLIPYIRELNHEGNIRAIDMSPGMIAVASRKYGDDSHLYVKLPLSFPDDSHLSFQVADAESDDIPGRYHQILLYSVFPHLEFREETVSRLVSHNLKPDGVLLIAHSQSRQELNRMHRMRDDRVSEDMLTDVQTQKRKLEQVGLRVLEAVENSDFYYLIITSKVKNG